MAGAEDGRDPGEASRRGDPVASPPPPHAGEGAARRGIEAFLSGKQLSQAAKVPWPLRRADVLAAVRQHLTRSLADASAGRRLAQVMRVYLLGELVAEVAAQLASASEAGDVALAAWLCVALGWIGEPEQTSMAAKHLSSLIDQPGAWSLVDDLLEARQALGPAADSQRFEASLRAHVRSLETKSDYDSDVLRAALEELLDNDLESMRLADVTRARIAPMDDTQKLRLLVDVYLERGDYDGEEYLVPWAVLNLRSLAQRSGAESPGAAFRREAALSGVDETDEFVVVRALRAAHYFGVPLSPKDREFLGTYGEGQLDPLSKESLLSPYARVEQTRGRRAR